MLPGVCWAQPKRSLSHWFHILGVSPLYLIKTSHDWTHPTSLLARYVPLFCVFSWKQPLKPCLVLKADTSIS